ncbi:MAG: lipoyl synthase [Candidatus Omnitrophica bacterium]|nr:lipoyl synthase [Candidatus Omnitrophota bacterium]
MFFKQSTATLPAWFRQDIPDPIAMRAMRQLLRTSSLHSVCESSRCPNQGHCWERRVATFMILGDICTRTCRFCAVASGIPIAVDPAEPEHIGQAVQDLGLKYVVITSVTRDDLADQGAGQFVLTVEMIRRLNPGVGIELLVPDFSGREELVCQVASIQPEVVGHNIETVERLYPRVRTSGDYRRALDVLSGFKKAGAPAVKSGFMVGLGETAEEIFQTIRDLKSAGCDMITIGQYLAPTRQNRHVPVARFVPPEEFQQYERAAREIGIAQVAAGPLVRSSFMAEELFSVSR